MSAELMVYIMGIQPAARQLYYTARGHIKKFGILFRGSTAPSAPGPPHCRGFTITLRHTILGRSPLDE
jgi:hypothetical protein